MSDQRRVGAALAGVLALGLALLATLAFAAAGEQVTSYNGVTGTEGMVPVASAAGPSASDDLIGGGLPIGSNVVPAVFAVSASTGQVDSAVGSSGQLPMPSTLPGKAQVQYLLFAGNTIYASFSAGSDAYLASWNAQGQLNSGFGSGGLVTIAPPSSSSFNNGGSHLANGSKLALAGGTLVLGEALQGNGGGIDLYPLNPSSGAVGTPVITPLPSGGFQYVDLDAMQVGPDGSLYLAGEAHGSPSALYYGVFSSSTLKNLDQTTQADGESASAGAIAFSGSSAFLGVTSTTSSVSTTQLWSAPQGSATVTQGPTVPTQVQGQNQTFTALQTDSSGPLDAVVDDGGGGTGTTWVLQISGGSVGASQQVGSSGTNAQTVSGDALFIAGNGYFPIGEQAFLAVFGTGTPVSTTKPPPPGTGAPGASGCDATLDVTKYLRQVSDDTNFVALKREHLPGIRGGSLRSLNEYSTLVEPPELSEPGTLDRWLKFVIVVTNNSDCEAKGVKVADDLPDTFRLYDTSFSSDSLVPGVPSHGSSDAHRGRTGVFVFEDIGSLPPHTTKRVAITGRFIRAGKVENSAEALAENANTKRSQTVHVQVFSKFKEFFREKHRERQMLHEQDEREKRVTQKI